MPSVSHETVVAAVKEYGIAWETQDIDRIGRLFTKDAIYVERAFDKKATFRGRQAIQDYWKYQICGKQQNISFRHVESEMVRDADRPIAVVKWLAEFDNHREHRDTKASKRVRFCQMAKLVFDETAADEEKKKKKTNQKDDPQISYLEEYAQSMTGRHVRWPGLTASEEELYSKIRFEPPKPPAPVVCERCNASFPSRTKLFQHLQETMAATIGEDGKEVGCVPILKEQEMEDVLVCLSISYYCYPQHPQTYILNALQDVVSSSNSNSTDTDEAAIVWAVPPELTSLAVVNVVTIKMSRSIIKDAATLGSLDQQQYLVTLLNDTIRKNTDNESNNNNNMFFKVNSAGIVDRSFSTQRRDFEKYAVFIPWTLLSNTTTSQDENIQQEELSAENQPQPQEELEETKNQNLLDPQQQLEEKYDTLQLSSTATTTTTTIKDSPIKRWRKPLEDTPAFAFLDASVARRLKRATRLLKDGGHLDLGTFSPHAHQPKIRIRTSCMAEPWQTYCRISISMKQPRAGYVEHLVGLLVAYARFGDILDDKEFVEAFDLETRNVVLSSTSSSMTVSDHHQHHHHPPSKFPPLPFEFVVLMEPSMSRYENKVNLQLCANTSRHPASDKLKESISLAEHTILQILEKKESILTSWMNDCHVRML